MTCTVPNTADLGIRGGRLIGGLGFSLGAAGFGGFGGRELGLLLQLEAERDLGRGRRLALGLGSASVVAGLAGLVTGSVLFGVGAKRAIDLGRDLEQLGRPLDERDVGSLELARDHLGLARLGLMFLVASPTPLATGIGILANRPRRISLSPRLARDRLTLTFSGRF